jgi:hypothetical protein
MRYSDIVEVENQRDIKEAAVEVSLGRRPKRNLTVSPDYGMMNLLADSPGLKSHAEGSSIAPPR